MMPSPDLLEGDLKSERSVFLQSEKYTRNRILSGVRQIRGVWVLKFKDCDTIEDAYRLVGYEVWTQEAAPPREEADDAPLHYAVFDEQGNSWGIVVATSKDQWTATLEVEHQGRRILIPWHPEIVLEVDSVERRVLISPPEGLMDLNS